MRSARGKGSVAGGVTIFVSVAAAGVGILAWKNWHSDIAGGIAFVVSLVAAVLAAGLQWAAMRQDQSGPTVSDVLESLAREVRRTAEAEAEQWAIDQPWVIPVEFTSDADSLGVDWADVERAAQMRRTTRRTTRAQGPDDLTGTLTEISRVFARVPSQRLVVLGGPGAGKTVLAGYLTRQMLSERREGDPVPVILGLASWNPAEETLPDWMANRLAVIYRGLGAPAPNRDNRTLAQALIDDRSLIPVLDGLDEIDPAVRGFAISAINEALHPGMPLVVTSRYDEFATAVEPPRGAPVRLNGFAVIRLSDLSPAMAIDYLRASAGGPRSSERWRDVFEHLEHEPGSKAGRILRTPLMLGLARALYNPAPRRDGKTASLPNPAELLDGRDVEVHLLSGFLDAAYRSPIGKQRRPPASGRARQSLEAIARNLDQRKGRDINWWDFRLIIGQPRQIDGWIVAIAVFLATAPLTKSGNAFILAIGSYPAAALVPGAPADGRPRRVLLGFPTLASLRKTLLIAVLTGLFTGAMGTFLAGWTTGVIAGAVMGFTTWLTGPLWKVFSLDDPAEITTATPRRALAWDRTACIIQAAEGAVSGGALAYVIRRQPEFGIMFCVILCLSALLRGAWGRLVLARIWWRWKAGTPLRLMAFLDDAYHRNVLRQVGPSYQFRHAALQHYLAPPEAVAVRAPVTSMACTPGGRYLIAGGDGDRLLVWDIAASPEPVPIASIRYWDLDSAGAEIGSVAISPDGRLLAAAASKGGKGEIGLFDLSDPANPFFVSKLKAHLGTVTCLAFHPDGGILASGSTDRDVTLWDTTDQVTLRKIASMTHQRPVRTVLFAPDGTSLVTSDNDSKIVVWDLRNPQWPVAQSMLRSSVTGICDTAFSPAGGLLAVSGQKDTVEIWKEPCGDNPEMLHRIDQDAALTAQFHPDGQFLATGSREHGATIWDIRKPGQPGAISRGTGPGPVHSIAFPSASVMVTGGPSITAQAWDPGNPDVSSPVPQANCAPQPEQLARVTHPSGKVIALSFGLGGRVLISGGRSSQAIIWDISNPKLPARAASVWHGPKRSWSRMIDTLAVHPGGSLLATGGWGGYVALWDLSNPREPAEAALFRAHQTRVAAIAFHPSGQLLATASDDKSVLLWDIAEPAAPRQVRILHGHDNHAARATGFSQDGRWLATGGRDGTVVLWDLTDPARPSPRHRLQGRTSWVYSAVFSHDTTLLAAGGRKSGALWQLRDGESPELIADGISFGSYRAAFTAGFDPCKRELLTGSWHDTAILWNLTDLGSSQQATILAGGQKKVTSVAFHPDGGIIATGSLDSSIILWKPGIRQET